MRCSAIVVISAGLLLICPDCIAWLCAQGAYEIAAIHKQPAGESLDDLDDGEAQEPFQQPPAAPEGKKDTPSEAERYGDLWLRLQEAKKKLAVTKNMDDPNSEFNKSKTKFLPMHEKWKSTSEEIERLKKEGKDQEAEQLLEKSKSLKEDWEKARKEFNLAIQELKTSKDLEKTLTQDIKQLQTELDSLVGKTPPQKEPAAAKKKEEEKTPKVESPPGTTEPKKDEKQPPSLFPSTTGEAKKPSEELKQAKQQATAKEKEVKAAKDKVASIAKRMASVQEQIKQEQKLLEIAREKLKLASDEQLKLSAELRQKQTAGAKQAELNELASKLQSAIQAGRDAQKKVKASMDNLSNLQKERDSLQASHFDALRELNQKERTLQEAEERVSVLENPFHPRNLMQWFWDHGLEILIVIGVVLLLNRLIKYGSRHIANVMSKRSGRKGSDERQENRAQTLVGVSRGVANIVLFAGAAMIILEEIGIPVVPLLGGAAVVGLAVAFGTQHLIKDYFTGFMVLLEDQYGINDWVKIDNTMGCVEKITLRTTVLRDLEGTAHFIPHGNITTVSNLTHGWANALFEIGIAYKEETDRVMHLLLDISNEMRNDAGFGPDILGPPEMLGVDMFGDSSVTIKFYMKTRPGRQWAVRRELLRRIKHRFDEEGIEIPFPHRTIFHHYPHEPSDQTSIHNDMAKDLRHVDL